MRVSTSVTAGASVYQGGSMDVLIGLVDEELRLELILVEALHTEAERLAAQSER
ncbi:hypothetical protein GCM10017559_75590 [Streptosporangium longisporum]|uniref:Uncharacterized protein n=1 Tax=Streptosporangium longisporum TaxID=46187 RepID=A0ABP6LEH4_9ACTN